MRSEYQILLSSAVKLGDSATASGERYTDDFVLPDNFINTEPCIIMCKTRGCNGYGKLYFNYDGSDDSHQVRDILEPHNGETNDEWMTDLAIVGTGLLKPGSNDIYIFAFSPAGSDDIDDFHIDNIVLWYKCAEPRIRWWPFWRNWFPR